ncbi:MAG: DNA-processing protein DprA [Bacteroidetes bacterium]|nr:DNA-processing protein DprA [Bacteroidota bacterium]
MDREDTRVLEHLPYSEEQRARAAILSVEGMGPIRTVRLLDRFGSASIIIESKDEELIAVDGISPELVQNLRKAWSFSGMEKNRAYDRSDSRILLTINDADYPQMLRSIYAPPAIAWVQGENTRTSGRCIAIVGTRRPSAYGKSIAYSLAYELASNGITIVSGLAYGIDSVAHQATLDAGGKTIAILGSGLNRLYPAYHRRLADKICERGFLFSEFPLDMAAKPGHFPRRNRIISGMTEATIVVEAYEKGGALLTARMALDQNREVYAVPGQLGNPAAEGTNHLIQNGEAQLFTSASDLIEELQLEPDETQLSATDLTLLQSLSVTPTHIDDLADHLCESTSQLLIQLLRLECSGKVRQLPGKYFVQSGSI